MQVRRIGYRVKGLYRVGRLGVKWGMIAPDTEKRLKILRFWEEHGLKATRAARSRPRGADTDRRNKSGRIPAHLRLLSHP
jgi:hypothetical protein